MRFVNPFALDLKNFRSSSPKSGFTLLEVLVALALLGISMVAIFELFSSNLKGITASDDYVSAILKAESQMREILDNDNLTEESLSATMEDGSKIDTSVVDTATDRTENLPVKLLEVSVTIHWTRGTRERSFTLKTMKLVNKQV
jgi:general secretion pathway protein I